MKTKLLLLMVLLYGLPMMAQDITEKVEAIRAEADIQIMHLKDIEGLLSKEQQLLESSKGNPDASKQITDNIEKYTQQRDSIIKIIQSIKAKGVEELKSMISKDSTSAAKKQNKDIKNAVAAVNELAGEVIKPNTTKLNDYSPKYLYLNGFNFDFNNTQKIAYVGHFNIYVPAKKRWGYNTGILKVNYQSKDTAVHYIADNLLKHPLQVLAVDSIYKRQYNRYAVFTKATSFSTYFQVLRRLYQADDGVKRTNLCLHLHTELLSTKYEINARVKTIDEMNVTIHNQNEIPANVLPLIIKDHNFTTTIASGYFGVGVTLDLKFLNNCSLFIQGTAGAAVRHNGLDTQLAKVDPSLPFSKDKVNSFYLVRSYFQYHVSTSVQIVIGTDIRGNLPHQETMYSTYAGINIGIDKLGELLK